MRARTTKEDRPLTPRGLATRERIVKAAADLIYDSGAGRLNLDEVMEASRTSKSQLYHYFTDKEALIQAVIVFQAERVLGYNASSLDNVDSLSALRRWGADLIERNRTLGGNKGCPIGALADELANGSPINRELLAGSLKIWAGLIEQALKTMKSNGALDPSVDAEELSVGVLAALQGGLLLAKVSRTSRPIEIALDMALDHVARQARPVR